MATELIPGDTVSLKSGSPCLTIEAIWTVTHPLTGERVIVAKCRYPDISDLTSAFTYINIPLENLQRDKR